jgi:MacB-like periplasmic core domain
VTPGGSPTWRPPEPKQRAGPRPERGLAAPSPASALTIAGIALGASLIFASLAVSGGVERSIDKTVEATLGRTDFRISAPEGATLSEEMLVAIRSVLGVVVGPAVEQSATLLPEDETAPVTGSPVTILGIDPLVDDQIHGLDLVAGETISRREEAAAVITERLAADEGYGLGSDVIVATPGEPERFRVVGIAAGDGPIPESDGRTMILPIEAVTRMFGLSGVGRVDLLVEEGVPVDGVRAELGEALAGNEYVLLTPGELGESLRGPAARFAATATALGALGALVGALLALGTVRLMAPEDGAVRSPSRVREAAVHGAIGAGIGAAVVFVLAAVTRSDIAPAAVGLGALAATIVGVTLVSVAALVLPPRRLPLTWARRVVVVLAVVSGLFVAIAAVGANVQRTAAEQAPAPVLGRLVGQLDAFGLLAVAIAGVAIVALVAMADTPPLAPREAAIVGLAGAVAGSIGGLAVGAALIVLGGGRVDLAADTPWAALGVAVMLGIGLAVAAASLAARIGGRLSELRAARFG